MTSREQKAKNMAARVVTSRRTRAGLDLVRTVGQMISRRPNVMDFYLGLDDPVSHLLAQVLPKISRRYDVMVRILPVGRPSPEFQPNRARYKAYALKDAKDIADWYGLNFPKGADVADPTLTVRALGILMAEREPAATLDMLAGVSDALWRADEAALTRYATTYGRVDSRHVSEALRQNRLTLESRGHYAQGALQFKGSWFVGLDRLTLLEAKLAQKDSTVEAVVSRKSILLPQRPMPAPDIEFYFSFSCPYSYLAAERVYDLAARTGVSVIPKPVLPLNMQGFPLPGAKRFDHMTDAARLAEYLDLPFGNIMDPMGPGMQRLFSLWQAAKTPAQQKALVLAALKGIWTQGIDVGTEAGARVITTRAGLLWEDVIPLDEVPAWETPLKAHQQELTDMGLWGVPSFRVGSQATWGQDRLWLVEAWLSQYSTSRSAILSTVQPRATA